MFLVPGTWYIGPMEYLVWGTWYNEHRTHGTWYQECTRVYQVLYLVQVPGTNSVPTVYDISISNFPPVSACDLLLQKQENKKHQKGAVFFI